MKQKSISFNAPILSLGLFPLLMVATSLKLALIYSLLFFLTLIISQLIVGAFRLIIAHRVRYVCYALVILGVIYFLDSLVYELFPKSYNSINSLIIFLFAGSLIYYSLSKTEDSKTFGEGLSTSCSIGLEFSFVMFVVGLARELLSQGTIWNRVVIDGFMGYNFFAGLAGGLLVVIIFALIYNLIKVAIKKRRALTFSLTKRYSAVIENKVKSPAYEDEAKPEDLNAESLEEVE